MTDAPDIMHALVGNLPVPSLKVRDERTPALEAAASDGVALHVADAAFVLALGSRPVGRAGPNLEAPVPREGVELGSSHTSRRAASCTHQRPGVIEQHLLGHAAEVAERGLDTVEPGRLPLVPEPSPWGAASSRASPRTGRPARARRRSAPASRRSRCRPGGVSKRSVARASATSSRRYGCTARSTVRRLTAIPCSRARSWPTTSALPRYRWNRSHSSSPSSRSPAVPWERPPPGRGDVALHRRPAAPEQLRHRRVPQPRPCSRIIAATSSGSSITSLRGIHCPRRPCHSFDFHTRLLSLQRGQFLVSSGAALPRMKRDRRMPVR